MKKLVSCIQLSLNFEYEEKSPVCEVAKSTSFNTEYFRFTNEDFEEAMAIECDIMSGRGAYLYSHIEKELAWQSKVAQSLRQFEAIRASIYR